MEHNMKHCFDKFEYTTLEKVTLPSGERYYVGTDGIPVSSVTTILDAVGDNTGLQEWRERVGDKKADIACKEGRDLGSLVHADLEKYVLGEERTTGNNIIRKMASKMANVVIEEGMPNVNEVWGIEKHLYINGLYAGTSDLIGVHQRQAAIIDFKTARKMKLKNQIPHYFEQCCAYAIAHNHLYGTNIRKAVIFMVDRESKFKEFPIDGLEFDKYQKMWFDHVDQFIKMKESGKLKMSYS